MEQINYQPAQASVGFNPVQQVDITSSLKENQAADMQAMNRELQQMQKNAQTKLQNMKNDAFPVQELAQFSNTLTRFVQERHEDYKKNVEADMTMLAFTDQMGVDPEFDEQERQLEETGRAFHKKAGDYEQQTGDVEGAERIRNLTGWEKYYYMKAKTQQAGKGFGAFMTTNATNDEFSVNGHTLASAPDAATRQAVAAKMASNYMTPYQGMNKSFLGKYLFPSMQQGMSSTIAGYAAENAKKLKANRLDEAGVLFRNDPSAAGAQQFRDTLTSLGYSNKEIRGFMLGNASTVAEVEAIGAIEFGGNGKTFAENYDKEYNEALNGAVTRQDDAVQRALTIKQQEDNAAKLAYMEAEQQDIKDGSFDADPARLAELAEQARMAGHEGTATYIESRISETSAAKSSAAIRKGYELQMSAGVIPSQEEIMLNPALTQEDKQALVGKAEESSSKAEPASARAKSHKEEIKAEIESRAQWDKTKSSNASVIGMNFQAWSEYTQVYNNELQAGASPDVAAQRAMADFRSKFGTDPGKGAYAIDLKPDSQQVMSYKGYSTTEQASTAVAPITQVDALLQGKSSEQRNEILNNSPDLFYGEEKILQSLQETASTTGQLGVIPPVYYELQQRYGGRVGILDMVQQRLKANGLKPLPDNVTNVVSEVQGAFDTESYKYISYKPNATRTDIGLISSGQDPVYSNLVPRNVADDTEFQSAVSATAQRLGVSEADLYAIMSFETGGTFNPAERNAAGSGATGLIQFMPSTAQGLGTSTEALAGMSRVQQMQYVETYLRNAGVRQGSNLSDLYMAVLFPAAVGKDDNFVLFGKGAMEGYTGKAYQQNKGLDSNGDGSITKAEASAKVLQHRNPAGSPWRQPNTVIPELQ